MFYNQSVLKSKYKTSRGQRGITLVEIIIVFGLLATIMVYLASNLNERANSAKMDQTKMVLSGIEQNLQLYKIHVNSYPSTGQGLGALVHDPGNTNNRWRGPYTEEDKLRDPWGNPFDYQSDGKTYKITSPGPDGTLGTADDISVPEAPAGGTEHK